MFSEPDPFEPVPDPDLIMAEPLDLFAEARSSGIAPDDPALTRFCDFALLAAEKSRLEARVKQIDETMKRMQSGLLGYFEEHGGPLEKPIHVKGMTVFRRSGIYPALKPGYTHWDALAALRAGGLGHFIFETYNKSSLGDHVRGLRDLQQLPPPSMGALLPPAVARIFHVEPIASVQARRSKVKKGDQHVR